MDNLEEMDEFLEMYNLPRLNQEEIEYMNRPITSNEIETVIKNFQQTKPKVSRKKEIIKIRSEINEKEMKEITAKANKTKTLFFEKINKIVKPLARLIKEKREKTQINRIRNEKGEVTTDTAEIQRIMRDYYKQLYANEIENLEEMDKFLEKHNLLRLNQEEVGNINRPVTSTEIETMIKNLPTNKTQDYMASQVNSIKHLETS